MLEQGDANQAQDHGRAVEEEVRDMPAMSLEDQVAEWGKLDDMGELTHGPVPVRSNEAGTAREKPQESSPEIFSDRAKNRAMDGDFGMEM